MKLQDFLLDEQLNGLRRLMNAELGSYAPVHNANFLTAEEIERLAGEGIEIPIDQVRTLNDGTHVYKGRRVIVYIRDVQEYGGQLSLPKFHLAMCDTLLRMIEEGRYKKRYVVATRDDGKFKIHKIKSDVVVGKSDEPLEVCQHCLDEISYRKFSLRLSSSVRRGHVKEFSIQAYYEKHGRTCIWAEPKFDADHAPLNTYGSQFYKLAKAIKEQRGYRCENLKCKIDLSTLEDRKFLHAHHIDADKSDSHPRNMRLLCIRCHAAEFQHSHLQRNPQYDEFCLKYPLAEMVAMKTKR